jgi:integrase
MAIDEDRLRELPRMKMLDEATPPKRKLITPDEFDAFIKAARTACPKNGEQLADYLRFLAFSGTREKEALRVRWEDVDFKHDRETIGSDGQTKNWESHTIEFMEGALLFENIAGDTRRKPITLNRGIEHHEQRIEPFGQRWMREDGVF